MDLMTIRRRLLMQEIGGLPGAYRQIEWIRMPSGAYFDSGYIPTVAPKIDTRMQIHGANDADIFGFINNVFPSFIVDPLYRGETWYNRCGSTSYTIFSKAVENVANFIFGQYTIIDGVAQTPFADVDWSSNTQSMRIGAGRNNTGDIVVYTLKLYDGDVIVRNFIPCIRKADSKPGMYDTVSKAFFINEGTGEFVAPT